MPVDIIQYTKDPHEFFLMIKDAKTLGFTDILVLIDEPSLIPQIIDIFKNKKTKIGINLYFATFVSSPRKIDPNIVPIFPPERKFFELKRAGLIYFPEIKEKKDSLHFRRAGINEYLAKKAFETKKVIAAPIRHLFYSSFEEKSKILGRMIQNANFANKKAFIYAMTTFAKNRYELISPKQLQAIALSIGLHPTLAKKSIDWLYEVIEN